MPASTKRVLVPLLAVVFMGGCVSFDRDAYIKSHSFNTFMTERPKAAEIIHQHPALEQWLCLQWSRPVGDFQIIWDNQEPIKSPAAESMPSYQYHLIAIHVSKKLSPLDQIVCLSFETCNARGIPHFDEIAHQAAAGKISRADFVDQIEATEYGALLRLKECFPKLLPPATNNTSTFYHSLLEVPIGFEKYKDWQIQNHNQNYLNGHEAYGHDYDKILVRIKISNISTSITNSTNSLSFEPIH
jgi:hypothetical protein